MNCENTFCIYWDNYQCELNDISLDNQGTCQNCIQIEIEDEELKERRKQLKNKYNM